MDCKVYVFENSMRAGCGKERNPLHADKFAAVLLN